MGSSLWDPPIYEDDSSDFGGNSQSNFYFDLGRDVIEEDAINEKCCIQVLNILIPKADAEIEELEQEIILLQGQLAWTDEVWSQICTATLTERINALDLSIQALKNEKLPKNQELDFGSQTLGDQAQNEILQMGHDMNYGFQTDAVSAQNELLQHEVNFGFQTHGDPAQNEILQMGHEVNFGFQTHGDPAQNEILQMGHEVNFGFQTHGDPAQNEQPLTEQELDFLFQTLGESSQNEKLPMEHEQNFCFQTHDEPAQNEKQPTEHELDFRFQTYWEPAPKLSEIIKTLLEKFSPNRDEQNSSSVAEKLATCQSNDQTKLCNFEASASVATTLEETVEPLRFEAPKVDVTEKHQNGDTTLPDSIKTFSGHASEMSTKRKMNEINSSIEIGQGAGLYDPTTKAEKRLYTAQIEKEAFAGMVITSANALRYEAGSISGKVGCNQSEEICGGVVVQSLKIESSNLKPSPKPKETTSAEADMLADMASVCVPHPVKQIAKESISKQNLRMLADADQTNRIDTPQQLMKTERMTTEILPRMKQGEPWLYDSERTIGESFLGLLNNKRKDARKPLIKEKQKPQLLKQMQNTEVVRTEPSMSNFLLKTGSPRLEEQFPILESEMVPEPSLSMGMEHRFSFMKNVKRNLMSSILDDKNFANKKIKEETHLHFGGQKSFSVASGVNINSARQSPGNRKKCVISPLVKKNEVHQGKMNALFKKEDEPISNFHAAKDASVKPLKLLSCTTSVATVDLNSLPMAQLRAMAKERNLTRYSKLNKSDLIKLLEQ